MKRGGLPEQIRQASLWFIRPSTERRNCLGRTGNVWKGGGAAGAGCGNVWKRGGDAGAGCRNGLEGRRECLKGRRGCGSGRRECLGRTQGCGSGMQECLEGRRGMPIETRELPDGPPAPGVKNSTRRENAKPRRVHASTRPLPRRPMQNAGATPGGMPQRLLPQIPPLICDRILRAFQISYYL